MGANIPTLAAGEYLVLIIDNEILHLTAYTSGSTSGTVTRGVEQTTPATHSSGATVLHAPTVLDFEMGSSARQNFTATAGQTVFTLSETDPDVWAVTINGQILDEADYAVSGNTLTLDSGAVLNDGVSVFWNAAAGGDTANFGYAAATPDTAYSTVVLGSTPVNNSEQLFINGMLVAPDEYTRTAAQLALTSRNVTPTDKVVARWRTTSATPGSISFTGSPSSPALRGADLKIINNLSSDSINIPAGAQAGDLTFMYAATGWVPTNPSGWTVHYNGGSNVGAIWSKTLTAGEISTGSFTVSFSGTHYGVLGIATFIGGTAGIREVLYSNAGFTNASLTSTTTALSSDAVLYLSYQRVNNTITVNRGTLLEAGSTTETCGAMYYEDLTSTGTVTATYACGASAGSALRALIIVKGA